MIETKILKSKLVIWIAATLLIVAIILLTVVLSKAYIKITVNPNSARVTVNNMVVPLDNTGYGEIAIKPGDATIDIVAEGYIGNSQKVSLKAGKSSSLKIELRKNPTPITIGDSKEANNNVQFISEADEDNSLFYLANNGSTLYKAKFNVDSEGTIKTDINYPISNPPLSGIQKIIWSPKKDSAIFKKAGGVYTMFDFKKYNFVSQEEVKYGENIGDLVWSPDDSKIAYYYAPGSGEKSLIFADKVNSNINRVANLAEMGIENPFLAWSPNSEQLIVIPRNKDTSQNKIYLFSIYTRSFKIVNEEGSNLDATFTPDSKSIIYSTSSIDPTSPVRQMLSIMNLDGSNKRSLDLRASISKTSFLYTMPEDLIVSTYDSETRAESMFLYDFQYNQPNGFKMKLAPEIYTKEMSVSKDDKILFYIANDKFYALALKK